MNSKVTYRQQFTRCGKQRCHKCKDGAGHGPYWYAYWSENGRTISKYIGINPPTEIQINHGKAELQPTFPTVGESSPHEGRVRYNSSELNAEGNIAHINSSSPTFPKAPGRSSGATTCTPALRVYLLGQFRVERRHGHEWQGVANRKWQRRRARALLGCLVSNPARRLGREQVMEALWPDLDTETAANRLNGAVHELRQILEPEIARPAASQLLRLERDVLILADSDQIWVDAEAFEGLLNKANTTSDPEQVEQLLEEAAALYGGDYLLEELYSEWTAPRRESLRRGWMGLLLNLAELRAARGALANAIEPLDRLLSTDPTHETAVRRLMTLLTQLDRRGEALRVYHRLVSVLQHDYDSDPLPETRELYEALRQGNTQIPQVGVPHTAKYQFMYYFPNDSGISGAVTHYRSHIPRDTFYDSSFPATEEHFVQKVPTFGNARQSGRHNQSPLVGRDKELDTMRQLMLAVENESSLEAKTISTRGTIRNQHLLLLMGESGIGKTRLAEELSQEAITRGWSVAWSRAFEQEGTISYRPWTELLRVLLQDAPKEFLLSTQGRQHISPYTEMSPVGNSLLANHVDFSYNSLERLSVLLPELSPRDALLQLRPATPLSSEQERFHLWEASLAILSALSRTTPILLVLDDLHWTDDSSLELLAYLARHLQDERILIVGTCRDAELMPSSNLRTLINDLRREQAVVTLPVQPLTQSQIASLVAYLPEDIVQSIQTQAGGNPFFAEELARYSDSDSDAVNDIQIPATAALPETIAAVLDRRLDRLSGDCQSLLGKAAVLGRSFELRQLLFMTGHQGTNEDAILDLLDEALRAGLLTEEGTGVRITYHFWHPLIVSHLYERLSAARRAQLHRRAANTFLHLHQGHEAEVAAAITHHLIKGGSDPTQIAHYAEIAGNQAYALSAYSDAQFYYRQAIEAITEGNSPEVSAIEQNPLHLASLLERVAECNMVQGNYEEVRQLYERVLELRNQQRADRPESSDAQELQNWQQQEAQRQAMIWREIGRAWFSTGDYTRAQQCFIHGERVLREVGVTSGPAWACLQLQHGNIARIFGNFDEARQYTQVALEILEQVTKDRDRNIEQSNRKRTSNAELETRTSRSVIGDPLESGRVHEIIGIIEFTVGNYSEALKRLKMALAIFERYNLVMAMAQVCSNLGAVYAMIAENSVARAYFQRSLDLAERMGDLPNIALATGNLADVLARCGCLLEAEAYFKRSLEVAERANVREHLSWCCVALAAALQDQGNLRGALEYIRRAISLGRAIKNENYICFALIALADLRVTQAITICKLQSTSLEQYSESRQPVCDRLLARARVALQRALSLDGLEVEAMTEGQLILAHITFLFGDLETARLKAMQTLEEACRHQIKRVLARSHRLLGSILTAQEQYEEATLHFEQAAQVFREHEFRLEYARTLYTYGTTLLHRNRQKALAYLSEARDIFIDCCAAIDLEMVESLLATTEFENVVAGK